ncbi:hypothetical protein GP486_002156 [Trichoglossum hirsutum]|uniref:Ankyrin repeat protein n=1 Tax=Trichoglossum hirsutum TaxID=265104 RepID=A0A9P8RRY9_9PEZI|nr:hypothetical protein GP486_002156 [Trichoglossum hirsutum]
MDTDASLFSRAFYDEFQTEAQIGKGTVNYAKAMQKTVLSILDERRTTLVHWAPFVLHGCWISRVQAPNLTPDKLPEVSKAGHEGAVCRLRMRASQAQKDEALHLAAGRGRLGVVRLLLTAGAHPDFRDKRGDMPLHAAAAGDHEEIVRWLLDNGADPGAPGFAGDTALHMAVRHGHADIVQSLCLEMMTDIDLRNVEGKTARDVAVELGCHDLWESINASRIIRGLYRGSSIAPAL